MPPARLRVHEVVDFAGDAEDRRRRANPVDDDHPAATGPSHEGLLETQGVEDVGLPQAEDPHERPSP